MRFDRPLELVYFAQNYAWGRRGADSLVARLLGKVDDQPYAEAWIGAHAQCPSHVVFENATLPLNTVVASHPAEMLGKGFEFGIGETPRLPILFKVLSVNPEFGLSIQLHPNLDLARSLHLRDQVNYPDPSDKPEAGVAITEATLLYDLRSLPNVVLQFNRHPELDGILPGDLAVRMRRPASRDAAGSIMREIWHAVMHAEPSRLRTVIESLVAKVSDALRNQADINGEVTEEDRWVVRLHSRYGSEDPGLVCFYLLNLCHLHPGKAVYIGPDIPHAYLDGEIVECMKESDLVVRAGTTNKFRDKDALLDSLDVRGFAPGFFAPIEPMVTPDCAAVRRYPIPTDAFSLDVIEGHTAPTTFESDGRFRILFCLAGAGHIRCSPVGECVHEIALSEGSAVFVPAAVERYELTLDAEAVMYRAGKQYSN